MHDSYEPTSVEQVLDAYMAASSEPSREILAEWIARYPQYEQELVDLTVAWIQSNRLPAQNDYAIDVERGIRIGLEEAQRAYTKWSSEGEAKPSRGTPLVSFLQEGNLHGLSAQDLAEHLQLSLALLRKLENRLVRVETIPLRLIERLADTLERGIREISAYLALPPMLPRGLRLKARQRPMIPDQENFLDAVRADESLNPEQRSYWLPVEEKLE